MEADPARRRLNSFVIISPGILKRLVGQKLGDQFFERIREGSHGGTKARRRRCRKTGELKPEIRILKISLCVFCVLGADRALPSKDTADSRVVLALQNCVSAESGSSIGLATH